MKANFGPKTVSTSMSAKEKQAEGSSRSSSRGDMEDLQQTKSVTIHAIMKRGQAWINNQEEMEAVFLTVTPSRILYVQKPRVFVQSEQASSRMEKILSDTKRANDEYLAQVKKNQEGQGQQDVGVQTVEVPRFERMCGTAPLVTAEKEVHAAFGQLKEKFAAQEQIQRAEGGDDAKFQDKNTNAGEDFDDGGSVYTGKDDAISDAGTQYTQGTQKTATQSLNSVGDSVQDGKGGEKQMSTSEQRKIFTDKAFINDLILAEMLALQQPLLPLTTLFRGGDIQFDPAKDYKQILTSEYKTGDSTKQQKLSTKLLFTYKNPKLAGLKAVYCDFSANDERLLLVGYAGPGYGALALWQPENPDFYKILVYTRLEVTCCRFFPTGKSIVAAGFADGSVGIIDFREENLKFDKQGFILPVLVSSNKTGKHTSKVWELAWVGSGNNTTGVEQSGNGGGAVVEWLLSNYQLPRVYEPGECDNLVSVATDGRVVERSLRRNFEQHDILTLVQLQPHPVALVQQQKTSKMTIIRKLVAGLSMDFLSHQDYLVAGDDAIIRKASRAYSEQTSQTYQGHLSSVYRVRVNRCDPGYFLTCSADRTARVWDVGQTQALVTLRTTSEEHLYAAEWCPYKATLLVTGAKNGLVELWDLNETTVYPVLRIDPPGQARGAEEEASENEENDGTGTAAATDNATGAEVTPAGAVRYIAFSPKCPVFCVCYDNGWVQVHRLFGVEDGLILRSLDLPSFLEVEHGRMMAVVQNAKAD